MENEVPEVSRPVSNYKLTASRPPNNPIGDPVAVRQMVMNEAFTPKTAKLMKGRGTTTMYAQTLHGKQKA